MSLHFRLPWKSLGVGRVCPFLNRSKLFSVQLLWLMPPQSTGCWVHVLKATWAVPRGWLSPNCNPATCRVFDPLNTWAQKINLDDAEKKACTLKTADMDRNLQILPEWTFWTITALCLQRNYQWNQCINPTSYIHFKTLEMWHTTGIPPCLRLWQAWRFNSNRMALSSMFLLIGGGLRGAGSMRTQERCCSMANAIKLNSNQSN